jgi:acetyl-CoA carboxylase carboxyltransferase component
VTDEIEPSEWQPELAEIEHRRALARELGGAERVARQRELGKLTVRERIDALLDADTFREVGSIAGRAVYDDEGELVQFTPSTVVTGDGRIDGRPVVVAGDDFTIRGGAGDAAIVGKLAYAERYAHACRMPLVRLVEAGGGSVRALEEIGHTYIPENPAWEWVVANLATVPVVALALGPCAGLPAARVVASHYSLMVEGISQVFAAGPPLVAQIGQQVTKEELGGPQVHARNGTITDAVGSEEEAFDQARRFLSYLPSSIHELPPVIASADPVDREEAWLDDAVPRNPRRTFKIRPVVEALVDHDSLLELGAGFGRSLATALARLDGHPVAVVATDSTQLGGTMTAEAARKYETFVDLASTFHLPVVHLVDQPGFAIGLEHERAATMRAGIKALSAVYQTRTPWCSVIVRRCFGVAGAGHANASRFVHRFAWPSASWGSLRLEGGVHAAYKREIEAAADPAAAEAAIAARLARLGSPLRTAEAFGIEEIVAPRTTRARLCAFAQQAYRLLEPGTTRWGFRG